MTEKEKELLEYFDRYLADIKCIGKKARGNYISWAKFLVEKHNLTNIYRNEDIDKIIHLEGYLQTLPDRKVYKKKSDLGNFRSTLKRFIPFNRYRICKASVETQSIPIDDMIRLVGEQASMSKAEAMYEAIQSIVIERGIVLSDDQKLRLRGNLAKYDSRLSIDKFFMPGSKYLPSDIHS